MSAGERIADCPCGSGLALAKCCGRYHGGEPAAAAEALMRSRYSAYVLGLEDYLLATWHSTTRPAALGLEGESQKTKWMGLKVIGSATDGDTAVVEFVARYRIGGGTAVRLHEVSRFLCEDGRWYYLDGDMKAH